MNASRSEQKPGTIRGYVLRALTAVVVLLLIAAFFFAFLLAPAIAAGLIVVTWVVFELVGSR